MEIVPPYKSLGTYFSETMTEDCHVYHLVNELSRAICVMGRQGNHLPTFIIMLSNKSKCSSLVRYGILVWATTSMENMHKFTVSQKRSRILKS